VRHDELARAAPPAPRGLSTESALQGAGLGLAMLGVVLGTGFAVAGEKRSAASLATRISLSLPGVRTMK
jgi:hypothetical protein